MPRVQATTPVPAGKIELMEPAPTGPSWTFGAHFRGVDGMDQGNSQGRPASIPECGLAEVLRLHAEGYGYRRISRLLEGIGVFTSKSLLQKLRKGQTYFTDWSCELLQGYF